MIRIREYSVLIAVVVLLGCDKGPQRYEVTGSVTFEGRPVPDGRIVFTPDNAAGNQGPQGVALIEAGAFSTEDDRRVIGGPHWVQILAFDGVAFEDGEGTQTQGRPLCPIVQAPVKLPQSDAKLSIQVTQGAEQPTATIELVEQ